MKASKGMSVIDGTALPPTSSAALQHSCRVFHQVQTWLENDVPATNWGWKIVDDEYVPVTTLLPAAPADLLSTVHCSCKGECRTNQCTCRKHGITCGPGCGNCLDKCDNREEGHEHEIE